MHRALLLIPLLVGCSRPSGSSPADSSAANATDAPSSTGAASPAASSGAASVSGTMASEDGQKKPAGPCELRFGFAGKVAGQEAFMRLVREGDRVLGRYFYRSVGVDIALAGSVAASGDLDLVEGDPKAATGHFMGRCEGGVLSGRWERAGKEEPFHLERVGALAKPMIATKRLTVRRKAKSGGTLRMKECVYEQRVFELFGAGSPKAEALLNRQDEKTLASRILSPDTHKDALACEQGLTASFGAGVVITFAGLVTIEEVGNFNYASAAHPGNAIGYSRLTHDLSTGLPVGEKELFSKLPSALVEKCVAAYVKAHDLADMPLQVDGTHFDVTPKGVHFFGADYPHATAALTGNGPTITWGALLREHALRTDSPAKRAWEGEKANADEKKDCIVEEAGKE